MDMGVPIAENQANMTPIQRRFLVYAHSEYADTDNTDVPDPNSLNGSHSGSLSI